ncbi:MAG: hypothetical protein LAT66_13185 [Alkalimonas sp.]|nr:hypothetical protein [Alkalimonas sp.]
MNGYRVGYFSQKDSGAHLFRYDANWLAKEGARPSAKI